ncbi:MAG: adenine deaminase [Erysipelotrichia bacterium]|nr:adenine deaminase [Erysipelotrichia bacterium]NCC54449.1 adenine deaminase [Erysipelotrichia bacterium]
MRDKLAMARKEKPADLVLKGGKILNVFSKEWIVGDIAIADEKIVGIGSYDGLQTIDVQGKYLVPGFIDAHMHIESSMLMPQELEKVLLKKGTTSIIVDPHEMVNVKKEIALEYLLEAIKHMYLDVYVMLPSSVPCSDFESNGAGAFSAEDMKPYLHHPRILGLGETMRFMDVIHGEKRMLDKLLLFQDRMIDGHAPAVCAEMLQAYVYAGVNNDHECSTFEEAMEKLRAGMNIFIREGSGARNVEALVNGFLKHNISFDHCMFCTDDKHLEDIESEGHISYCIQKAIALGVPIISAYLMATYQSAMVYGLKHKGALAAGYDGDIVVLDDIEKVQIHQVYKAGQAVDKITYEKAVPIDERLLHSVILPKISKEDIALKCKALNDVIVMQAHELTTLHAKEVIGKETYFIANQVYNKLCVIERHGHNGNIAVAPLKNFNIKNGAIATTVAHDSHNLIVAGDNDEDILLAIKEVERLQGGYVIASQGNIIETLPLRICGLMSEEDCESVRKQTAKMLKIARELGVNEEIDPFITLSFMALPVIPEIRLCDKGLFDVVNQCFIK